MVSSFKIYVIIASMINSFDKTIALKSLDQRKYYIAVFASNKYLENLENFNNFSLLGISEVKSGSQPTSEVESFVTFVNGIQYLF